MILIDPQTIVIGHLFKKGRPSVRVRKWTGTRGSALAANNGQSLLGDYWGGYVFVHVDDGRAVHVLRDPSGLLPCYVRRGRDQVVLAGDITDLASPGPRQVNFHEIARILASGDARGRRTCVIDVEELIAGECLTIAQDDVQVEQWWTPWDHVAPVHLDIDEAAARLHETVSDCVGAWASCFSSILLGLSGGLDSSIVAAAAAPRAGQLTALTLVNPGFTGDERPYARAVASSLGIKLRDAYLDLADIDVGRAVTPHHPWPISPIFKQAVDAVHHAAESELAVDAHFSGNGGDGIFCSVRSAVPLLDRFLSEGPRLSLAATVRDMSTLAGADVLTVLRRSWARYRRSGGLHEPRFNGYGLAVDLLPKISARGFTHPWLAAPVDALPGKSVHAAFLMRAQKSIELYPRRRAPPHIAPLQSQPIIELCLSIPTWNWIADGSDRAVARKAFRVLLPKPIIDRTQKGGPGEFHLSIYRLQREHLHALLREGVLAASGIIDTSILDEPEDPSWRGNAREQRILALAAAESWARRWSSA